MMSIDSVYHKKDCTKRYPQKSYTSSQSSCSIFPSSQLLSSFLPFSTAQQFPHSVFEMSFTRTMKYARLVEKNNVELLFNLPLKKFVHSFINTLRSIFLSNQMLPFLPLRNSCRLSLPYCFLLFFWLADAISTLC